MRGEARDRLILDHIDLPDVIARRHMNHIPNRHFDDCRAAAMLGLVEAANRYQPDRGAMFKTFAQYRIEGAIIDQWRKLVFGGRHAHDHGITVDQPVSLDGLFEYADDDVDPVDWPTPGFEDDLVDHLSTVTPAELVAVLLAPLPARLRLVLVECMLHGVPQREMARRLGVTEGRVSQLKGQALARLRDQVAA